MKKIRKQCQESPYFLAQNQFKQPPIYKRQQSALRELRYKAVSIEVWSLTFGWLLRINLPSPRNTRHNKTPVYRFPYVLTWKKQTIPRHLDSTLHVQRQRRTFAKKTYIFNDKQRIRKNERSKQWMTPFE